MMGTRLGHSFFGDALSTRGEDLHALKDEDKCEALEMGQTAIFKWLPEKTYENATEQAQSTRKA